MSGDEYVLGTDDDELWRLGYQAQLWRAQAYSLWERAGFTRGMRLLDLGAGPGFTTLDLAQLVTPSGHVTGVDMSGRFLEHLRARAAARHLSHVSVQHSALEAMELQPAAYDGAYARWVLCFVQEPEAVIARLAAALRPGGRFVVQDYLAWSAIRVLPPSRIFERACQAVERSWREAGGVVDIVARLPEMLARHGLTVEYLQPVVRCGGPSSQLWQWPTIFFRNYGPALVRMGLLSLDEQRELDAEWARLSTSATAYFSSPLLADLIAVKR